MVADNEDRGSQLVPMSVSLTFNQRAHIEQMAREQRVSVSRALRKIVRQWMASQNETLQ